MLWIGGEENNPAANGSFSETAAPAAPISMLLDFEGYEAARSSDVVVPSGGSVTQNVAAWRLDPVTNLSASQLSGVITMTWNRPQSVQVMPNPDVRYDVYANGVLSWDNIADTVYQDIRQDGEIVDYTVLTHYRYGSSEFSDTLQVIVDLAVDENTTGLPTVYALYQNYPNPFNPSTQIRLDVPETANASLMIYDITGRLVRTLYSGMINAGRYTFAWDSQDDHGAAVATGVYLFRFHTSHFTATEKMMLMK